MVSISVCGLANSQFTDDVSSILTRRNGFFFLVIILDDGIGVWGGKRMVGTIR